MIDNISSSSMIPSYLGQSSSSSNNTLSSSQLDTISSVLENYDSDNLSQSDAQSIVEAFESEGITPSFELAIAMEEQGFDAKEVGDLAFGEQGGGNRAGGGMPPPPPPPSEEEYDTVSTLIDSLFNSDEDDENSDNTSTYSDEVMNYTSKILNLNEDSKEEAMNLIEQYSSSSTNYSQEETSILLKTSLSELLNNNNNYKSYSLYA